MPCFKELISNIEGTRRKHSTLLIGIDGCGGSGKSTLAGKIQTSFENVTVVHMDDFHLPSDRIVDTHPSNKPIGADIDWRRVLKQVLNPLGNDIQGQYQRYDWSTDCLAEWHSVPAGGIVIVEGVYSLRDELFDQYDVSIWVECPRDIRLSRGLERDGLDARDIWENYWMIAEDIYMEKHKPQLRSNLIVNGTK